MDIGEIDPTRVAVRPIARSEIVQCLADLSSFVMRRSIVGESTRPYGRWFPEAVRAIKADTVGDLREYWQTRGWPNDQQLTSKLVEFQAYRRERRKCQLILDRLEESYAHKERVDRATLSIEHVLPQTIGDDKSGRQWQDTLGPQWFELHQQWVHTLGNLTLTGYNPDMSNRPFGEKKPALVNSNLVLNSYFETVDNWTVDEIRHRGKTLAIEVAALWPNPTDSSKADPLQPNISSHSRGRFDVDGLRRLSLERLQNRFGYRVNSEGEVRYSSTDGRHKLLCIASQPYETSESLRYWFGISPGQLAFLGGGKEGHVALCCGSPDRILWFELEYFAPLVEQMNETEGRHWHIEILWGDSILLTQPKQGGKADVTSCLLGALGNDYGSPSRERTQADPD